ncbi:DUF6192 family protein [Streptomyces sp. NPDC002742]|uniref:DUF6192 family protein n=1 Tax=Streptomyces sp. NPDC002742 TaxID=3364663 RepID=UPI003677B1BC
MSEELEKVGAVSQPRYEQIVAEFRSAAEQLTQAQFTIGDQALEIEPMGPRSGPVADTAWSVEQSLTRLAKDVGLPVTTAEEARWTASRWPADRRRKAESFTVHQVLARIGDDAERFAAIDNLPDGKTHWTLDDARRRSDFRAQMPVPRREEHRDPSTGLRSSAAAATTTTPQASAGHRQSAPEGSSGAHRNTVRDIRTELVQQLAQPASLCMIPAGAHPHWSVALLHRAPSGHERIALSMTSGPKRQDDESCSAAYNQATVQPVPRSDRLRHVRPQHGG